MVAAMDATERNRAEPAATHAPGRGSAAVREGALRVVAWIDVQCPYSDRAVAWLDALPPSVLRVEYRLFALEQVNRDPAATDWRIWEQPLDYAHYRGRPDRRSLAAFLVTKLLERAEPPDVLRRFRRAVLDARFVGAADLSDLELLRRLAVEAGADGRRLAAALADETAVREARAAIASDWADAREPFAVFGVPTLDLGIGAPVYLRLERAPTQGEGVDLFDRLVALRREVPWLLELKTAPIRDERA